METGRIELVLGPMFSGKTSELLRRVRRYGHARKSCLCVKYKADTRYSDGCIATHDKVTSCLAQTVCATELSEIENFFAARVAASAASLAALAVPPTRPLCPPSPARPTTVRPRAPHRRPST